jgi:hypothetical protein
VRYALNQFLSKKGRTSAIRIASDFDYDAFRARLLADEEIPVDHPLVPSPLQGDMPVISRRSHFLLVLTQIQGSSTVNIRRQAGLLTLILDYNRLPEERPHEPIDQPADQPVDEPAPRPATPARVDEDDDEDLGDLLDETAIASTPEPPRETVAPADIPLVDLTGDTSISSTEDEADPIMRQLGFDFAGVENETWAEVCRFFNCDPDAEKIKVQGINLEIQPHQALAIWRALSQVAFSGIPSFMIADDVGFGKTGVSLCVTVIFHLIHEVYKEVQAEWKTPPKRRPKHLAQDEDNDDAICPTQGKRVQCPCSKKSLARGLVNELPDFPTLIVAPPQLIPSWLGESRKWIDKGKGSPASKMDVLVSHSSFSKQPEYLTAQKARLVRAELTLIPSVDNDRRYGLEPQKGGGSNNIILISAANVMPFLKRFQEKVKVRARGRRTRLRDVTTYAFGAAFVFFDEFHNYRGVKSAKSPTGPFEMLQHLREANQESPVVAIGVSGSCRNDPGNWRPFVSHAFLTASHLGRANFAIAGMKGIKEFDTHESDWNYLAQCLLDDTLEGPRLEARENRKARLYPFLRTFISEMMISRKKGDKFRGQAIQTPRGKPIWVNCPLQNGPARTAFDEYTSQVRAWFNVQFQEHIKRLTEQGVAVLPTRKVYLQQKVAAVSRNDPASHADRCRDYQIILRSSAFPAVAQLIRDNTIGAIRYESILVKEIGPIAQRISQHLTPESYRDRAAEESVIYELSGSEWMPHRQTLLDQSPKIAEVQKRIEELLTIATMELDNPSLKDKGPPPPDGTNLRHMLILSDNPLSAFLTLMVLFPRYYRDEVQFLYVHSQVSPFDRFGYCEYMQKDCTRGDPLKIMISTLETLSEGVNLFRAHTVILTEVPRSWHIQNQAFGRVDRTGQVMTPALIQLYDSNNLAEVVRQRKNQNRGELADVGPEDFGLADLVMNADDEQ